MELHYIILNYILVVYYHIFYYFVCLALALFSLFFLLNIE